MNDENELQQLREEVASLRAELQSLRSDVSDARNRVVLSMRQQQRCPACGAREIFFAKHVTDVDGSGGRGALGLVLPSLWSSRRVGVFSAYVCKGCGFVEWYIKDTDQLEEHPDDIQKLDGPQDDGGPFR